MSKVTTKPWGRELLCEVNTDYAVKILVMNAGEKCSLQKHNKKRETFVLITGTMLFTHKGATRQLQPVQAITIEPGEVHQMEAVTNITYVECSTPELDDVVRLDDPYGRK